MSTSRVVGSGQVVDVLRLDHSVVGLLAGHVLLVVLYGHHLAFVRDSLHVVLVRVGRAEESALREGRKSYVFGFVKVLFIDLVLLPKS